MSLMLDISGFEAIFRMNYQPLCAASYRIVQDKDIAEDIVQDIVHKLWEKREVLVLDTSLKTYLFKKTIEQSVLFVTRFRPPLTIGAGADEGLVEVGSSEQLKARYNLGRPVDDVVRALPEVSRLVFILNRFHRMHFVEIAEQLQIPLKTVEDQMTGALNKLRKGFAGRGLYAYDIFDEETGYLSLSAKYVSGEISLDETEALLDWTEEDSRREELLRNLQLAWDSTKNYPEALKIDTSSGWLRLMGSIKETSAPAKKDYSSLIKWSVLIGVIVFLLACFVYGLYYLNIL